jgi:hypothetical protein
MATLRAEERASLDLADRQAADAPGKAIIRATTDVLQRAHRLLVDRAFSPPEHARAQAHRSDPRIADALDHAHQAGFAEHIAAGPAAVDRLTAGRNGAHPVGAALVDAAIDCRRAGHHRPLPRSLLERVYQPYLPSPLQHRHDLPSIDQALAWVTHPVRGATCLLTPAPNTTYIVFDYLVDHIQTQPTPRAVPDHIWTALLDTPTLHATDLFTIGYTAYTHNRQSEAETWYRRAATDHQDPAAMCNLGVLLQDRGSWPRPKPGISRSVRPSYRGQSDLRYLVVIVSKSTVDRVGNSTSSPDGRAPVTGAHRCSYPKLQPMYIE